MRIVKTALVWMLGILLCGPVIGHAHPAGLLSEDLHELFRACATRAHLFPVDVRVPQGRGRGVYAGSGPSTHSGQYPESCLDYTLFSAPLRAQHGPDGFFVYVSYNGENVTTSAFDCQHTTLTYAVLVRPAGEDSFSLASFAQIFGVLENGMCSHGISAAMSLPSEVHTHLPYGANGLVTLIPGWAGDGEVRIMASSWAHNDPAIGHPGNLSCAPDTSCYYGASVTVVPVDLAE